jgi:glycosyltransferase involved in cell wall biosynthesis
MLRRTDAMVQGDIHALYQPEAQEANEVSTSKTIVSITEIKAGADSRSFKIAASFTRFGYTSILVEGSRSRIDSARLPFRLVTVVDPFFGTAPRSSREVKASTGWIGAVWRVLKRLIVSLPLLSLWLYIHRYALIPLRFIPRGALYYLHGYALFPAAYLLSMRDRTPIIYDAHDFYCGIRTADESQLLGFGGRWIEIFNRFVESRLTKKASAVVTVSNGVAHLQQQAFGCQPVVIRNCHDFRLDQSHGSTIRRALHLSSHDFLLVVIGNAKAGMAVAQIVEAISGMPKRTHLAFIGDSYDIYERVIRGHLRKRIHFVAPRPPDQIVPFIRTADASIVPYYDRSPNYENCLPNGFFQAIAAGLPLLYPKLPEIYSLAKKHKLGILVNTLNHNSIRRAATRLMNDPDLLAKYRRNVLFAAKDLNWENEETILRDLITRTLASVKEE